MSEHIQSLETAFGAPLFLRSTRGVQPTQAGKIVQQYALQLLDLLAQAEREVAQISAAQAGQLTVSATPGVSVNLLPSWLQTFRQTHPAITVSLQTALTHEIVRDVLAGVYQFGVLEGELDELDNDLLGRAYLQEITYFVVVGAKHDWANQRAIHSIAPSDLGAQPFINRQPTSRTRRWLEKLFVGSEIALRNVAALDSPGAIKYALLNNMGVAILPDYSVEREAERGDSRLLQIENFPMVRPLLLVWDRRRAFNAIQRAFISQLAGRAPSLQLLL